MRHRTGLLSASLLVVGAMVGSVSAVGNSANAQAARAVTIGGDGTSDACPSVARVTGLKRGGDNFLSVRAGPGSKHREMDRLGPKAQFHVCEEKGDWMGVVYAPVGRNLDCGVSAALPEAIAYRGPCRSGWVHRRFVEVIAG